MNPTILFAKLNVTDEAQACSAVDTLTAEHELLGRMVQALGGPVQEVEGRLAAALQAAQIAAERIPALEAELKSKIEAEESRERNALLSQIRANAQLTTDQELSMAASWPMDTLRGFAKTAAPKLRLQAVAPAHKESESVVMSKRYADMTGMERQELLNSNPSLFHQLRNEWWKAILPTAAR